MLMWKILTSAIYEYAICDNANLIDVIINLMQKELQFYPSDSEMYRDIMHMKPFLMEEIARESYGILISCALFDTSDVI